MFGLLILLMQSFFIASISLALLQKCEWVRWSLISTFISYNCELTILQISSKYFTLNPNPKEPIFRPSGLDLDNFGI